MTSRLRIAATGTAVGGRNLVRWVGEACGGAERSLVPPAPLPPPAPPCAAPGADQQPHAPAARHRGSAMKTAAASTPAVRARLMAGSGGGGGLRGYAAARIQCAQYNLRHPTPHIRQPRARPARTAARRTCAASWPQTLRKETRNGWESPVVETHFGKPVRRQRVCPRRVRLRRASVTARRCVTATRAACVGLLIARPRLA